MNDAARRAEFFDAKIQMAHGAGGEATRKMVEGLFHRSFANPQLDPLGDSSLIPDTRDELVVTTDSFVVRPLQFPGGSIGELAVNGTVNDLAVAGAIPLALTAGFIIEAGVDTELLRAEVQAMARAARRVPVAIVAGDTKVVEHGKADHFYINTTGIGRLQATAQLDASRVEPGDQVLLSGAIGDHGIAIMIARDELDMVAPVRSDTRSVLPLVTALLAAARHDVKWMRDATRGGVATVLNELVADADLGLTLLEENIPIHDPVRGACELLGLDPLHIANEGQFVAIVAAEAKESALSALRAAPGGQEAVAIGQITAEPRRTVLGQSAFGGKRVVDMLFGDPLPRIC